MHSNPSSASFVFNKISSSHLIHKESAPECCLSQPRTFTFPCFWLHIFLSYCTSSNCPKGRLSCASSFTFLIYNWQRLLSKPEMIIKDCGKWMAKNYFLKQTMILILWMNVSLFWKTCMCFKILSHGFHKPNEQGYNKKALLLGCDSNRWNNYTVVNSPLRKICFLCYLTGLTFDSP